MVKPILMILSMLPFACTMTSTQDFLDAAFLNQSALPIWVSPTSSTLKFGETVKLTVSGGIKPYTFSILSGKGTVASDGTFTAPDAPVNTVVGVKDMKGNQGFCTITMVVDQKLPNTASGMKLWIKADAQSISNNANVTGLVTDALGSTINFGANTFVGVFKTNIFNGKPVFRYDAAFSAANPVTGTNFGFTTATNTIIIVATTSSSSSGAIFTSSGTGSTPMLHANPFYWENQTATVTIADAIAMDAALPNSLNVLVITQTDSVLLQAFQNGVFVGEKVPVSPLNGKSINNIGGIGGSYYGGDIAEIILYNRVLTNAENYAIQCGLSKKWGFTMANCQ